jgi:hypothetical protein
MDAPLTSRQIERIAKEMFPGTYGERDEKIVVMDEARIIRASLAEHFIVPPGYELAKGNKPGTMVVRPVQPAPPNRAQRQAVRRSAR